MKIKRIHLGEIIHQKVKELGLNDAGFAAKIGLHRQNLKKSVYDKENIDTGLLCIISEVLECNLFNYFTSGEEKNIKELKATLTIEMGQEKKNRSFRFVFGENDIEILNR